MSLYNQGENEGLKGAVHGSLLTLSCLALNHNAMAYQIRPSGYLRFNKWFYLVVVVVEVYQVFRHIKGESE